MSMGTSAAVAAAVATEAERLRQEEEELTPYSDKDLAEGWEFKIVRAAMGAFANPERLRAVLEEEKKGGWILVEKFDGSRIRLKRPAGAKMMEGDLADAYDPYRTTVGMSGEYRVLIAVISASGVILTFTLMAILLGIR